MKLYAQHGSLMGEKVFEGFEGGYLDGVIFSPRDIGLAKLKEALAKIQSKNKTADMLLDPQYYICMMSMADNVRLGFLPDDYAAICKARRRLELSKEATIRQDVEDALRFQKSLPVTHIVAPNILISKSLDSREASIAIDFLSIAGESYKELNDKRPLLLTLAVSRDALIDRNAMKEFANEITGLGLEGQGIYLLVSANNAESRFDILHSDVIAAWMYLNFVLRTNGFDVVNGYSDILAPLLSAAGGTAAATGWWSNLRTFSLDRFGAAGGGGRLPTQRYLSTALWNRITFAELDSTRALAPEVLNGLPTDKLYDPSLGSEPQRNKEVLQSWDALRAMIGVVSAGSDTAQKLGKCLEIIRNAQRLYEKLQVSISFEPKSNPDHLPALDEGIGTFEKLAELGVPTE